MLVLVHLFVITQWVPLLLATGSCLNSSPITAHINFVKIVQRLLRFQVYPILFRYDRMSFHDRTVMSHIIGLSPAYWDAAELDCYWMGFVLLVLHDLVHLQFLLLLKLIYFATATIVGSKSAHPCHGSPNPLPQWSHLGSQWSHISQLSRSLARSLAPALSLSHSVSISLFLRHILQLYNNLHNNGKSSPTCIARPPCIFHNHIN